MRSDITLKIYKMLGDISEQINLIRELDNPKFINNKMNKNEMINLQWLKSEYLISIISYNSSDLEKLKSGLNDKLCDICKNGGNCDNDFINKIKINIIDSI